MQITDIIEIRASDAKTVSIQFLTAEVEFPV